MRSSTNATRRARTQRARAQTPVTRLESTLVDPGTSPWTLVPKGNWCLQADPDKLAEAEQTLTFRGELSFVYGKALLSTWSSNFAPRRAYSNTKRWAPWLAGMVAYQTRDTTAAAGKNRNRPLARKWADSGRHHFVKQGRGGRARAGHDRGQTRSLASAPEPWSTIRWGLVQINSSADMLKAADFARTPRPGARSEGFHKEVSLRSTRPTKSACGEVRTRVGLHMDHRRAGMAASALAHAERRSVERAERVSAQIGSIE